MRINNLKFAFVSALLAISMGSCATNTRVEIAQDSVGYRKPLLEALSKDLSSRSINLHSLLIEQKGRTIFEFYRNGWNTSLSEGGGVFSLWSDAGPTLRHDIRSVTKSVVALLAGMVLSRHPEYSVHSKIRDFPELSVKAPLWVQDIELLHFLTMTSGLQWKEWGEGFFTSDESALIWQKDPWKYSLDRARLLPPGSRFNYSGGSTFVAARMLELIDGRSIDEIAQKELFDPLDIHDWRWGQSASGVPLVNGGLGLRSNNMLKIGELMLAGGIWKGRQLVPAEWVAASVAPQYPTNTTYFNLDENGTFYGYFWWNGTTNWRGESVRWFSAIGNGGQKVFVLPRLELVVVMTAGDYGNPEIQVRETELLRRIVSEIE